MSIKKAVVWVLILVVSLGLLAGCGQTSSAPAKEETKAASSEVKKEESKPAETSKDTKKKVIGVMIGDFSAQFHAYIMDGMKKEAAKFPDVEFVYVDGKFDPSVQMGQAENFIAQKVDAIVFIPGDAEASKPAVDKIVAAKIPLINCNTKVGNIEKVTTYVGSDTIESGHILMEGMAKAMGGKGTIVELQGQFGHEPQVLRHQGIEDIIKKYPDIKVLATDTGKWSRDEGMKKMENWLQSDLKDKFDAVVAHNDEMAVGALKAIEAAKLNRKVLIGGIDATPDMLKYMKEGKITLTVFQDAFGQGAQSIDAAVKAANGEKLEKEYMIPYKLVMPNEADQYLALYGKK